MSGWVFDPDTELRGLEVVADDVAHALTYGLARPDVARVDAGRFAGHSGFAGTVAVPPAASGVLALQFVAVYADGRRRVWCERVVRLDASGVWGRIGNVLAGGVSALAGAWRARRWPGPPATWPGTIAHLWRGGPPRAALPTRPTPMDHGAFEASFLRYYRTSPSNPAGPLHPLPPLAVVAFVEDAGHERGVVEALRDAPGVAWRLWIVRLDDRTSDAEGPPDDRVRVLTRGAQPPAGTPWPLPDGATHVLWIDPETTPVPAALAPAGRPRRGSPGVYCRGVAVRRLASNRQRT